MNPNPLPARDMLNSLLAYDPHTGDLTWKPRHVEMFSDQTNPENAQLKWNNAFAGHMAFTNRSNGYLVGSILGRRATAHRVIFKMMTDLEPAQIDHINGVTDDNRIQNLRAVTPGENLRNTKLHADNKTGVSGISWEPSCNKWRASISKNGKRVYLGVYEKQEDAIAARRKAEGQMGFHKNHGRPDLEAGEVIKKQVNGRIEARRWIRAHWATIIRNADVSALVSDPEIIEAWELECRSIASKLERAAAPTFKE